jgi:hypothetical protein
VLHRTHGLLAAVTHDANRAAGAPGCGGTPISISACVPQQAGLRKVVMALQRVSSTPDARTVLRGTGNAGKSPPRLAKLARLPTRRRAPRSGRVLTEAGLRPGNDRELRAVYATASRSPGGTRRPDRPRQRSLADAYRRIEREAPPDAACWPPGSTPPTARHVAAG